MTALNIKEKFTSITAQGAEFGAKPYLVLDASWQQELAVSIRNKGTDGWEPLMGSPAEDKQEAHYRTPLLIDLNVHAPFFDDWLAVGFPEKLGIIIFSSASIEDLRTSLKRFISVITPRNAKPVYLRFYDARVLYCFLRHGFPEQWQDFFKNIELIAAPYDYTSSFAIYRFRNQALQFGVECKGSSEYRWYIHENKERAVENYRATFPFRQIEQRQYDDMMYCASESLLRETNQLLQEIKSQDETLKEDLQIHDLRQLVKDAERHECLNEQSKIYFCIAALLFGKDFHTKPEFVDYWKIKYQMREELLAFLIQSYADTSKNSFLSNIVSPWIP
ncbi:protein of unknown function [Pseudovibrio denitrificans]|uniref:DUF4123 domain-containing protein n=1 Tax=Pseudovibrio denitrificans TaxID=258256 RepID=A0A1I6YJ97_9HYPH|nr:DUF4123 domain-containing protein [Pseudovibrio denitrificans]SFT50540.1 protein of unknown function [Pseudovibrio denitrificans]